MWIGFAINMKLWSLIHNLVLVKTLFFIQLGFIRGEIKISYTQCNCLGDDPEIEFKLEHCNCKRKIVPVKTKTVLSPDGVPNHQKTDRGNMSS